MPFVSQLLVAVLTFLSLSVFQNVHADSPIWKITKGEHTLYVGGTIHLLTPADYPLPVMFDEIYNQSTTLVFETDLNKLNEPEFQQFMLTQVTYSDGRNLKQVLNAETYSALAEHLNDRGLPIDKLPNFKPGMMSVTLTLLELQRLGLTGTGVDEFYHTKATKDGKTIGQLETAESQITFLADMGEGQEDEIINYTLKDLHDIPQLMKSTKDAWRNGQLDVLKTEMMVPLRQDFPEVYQALLVNRNNDWIPQIERMLIDSKVEFILVGALHLVGKDGVIEQMKALGYEVEKL